MGEGWGVGRWGVGRDGWGDGTVGRWERDDGGGEWGERERERERKRERENKEIGNVGRRRRKGKVGRGAIKDY